MLIIGGIILYYENYQNLFAPLLIISAIFTLWLSQDVPRSKLLTAGLIASIIGIIFSAILTKISFFHELRYNPSFQSGNDIIGYLSGVTFFLGMIFLLMLGYIFLGISMMRSPDFPKISGLLFILAGIVAINSNIAGPMLGAAGLFWLGLPLRTLLRFAFQG